MAGLNMVHLIGNLGADPEFKLSQGGLAILRLRLAISEKVKKGDAYEDKTEWINASIVGKRAEALHKFLEKGQQVSIVGKIRTSSYEDKDGGKRYKTEIHIDDLILLGSRKNQGNAPTQNAQQQEDADDIPF